MAENLEQKVSGHPEKKEEKKLNAFESASSESSKAARGLVNTTIGAGAIALAAKYFGLDGLVTAASFPVGGMIEKKIMAESDESKKKFSSKNFRDEAIAGAAFTVLLWYGVNYMRGLPGAFGIGGIQNALAVGGMALASPLVFNLFYYPIKYLADNKTFKGLGKDFKEHYWKGTKRAIYTLGLPWSATVATSVAFPALYPILFPILAAFEVAYRVVLSKEKLNYGKLLNPMTYVPNFLNPFYVTSGAASVAAKTYGSITTAASDLGTAVRNALFKNKKSEISSPHTSEGLPKAA